MATLDFISAKIVMGYPFCFIFMVQIFCIVFELHKHRKITESVRSQKLFRSLADIAEHICQIKRKSDANFFPNRVNDHFFISGLVY